jgi:hypothetical protein
VFDVTAEMASVADVCDGIASGLSSESVLVIVIERLIVVALRNVQ